LAHFVVLLKSDLDVQQTHLILWGQFVEHTVQTQAAQQSVTKILIRHLLIWSHPMLELSMSFSSTHKLQVFIGCVNETLLEKKGLCTFGSATFTLSSV